MENNEVKDVLMVGAGPCALSAAIYTTREYLDTVLYEKSIIGGLAAVTDKVDNYPGFPDGIEGLRLAGELESQAKRFGAIIEFGDVENIEKDDDGYVVLTVDGKPQKAKSVLVATGSDYNKLGVEGEDEYYGRGVHYCATCDGAFYKDKKVAVVGGGNSGVQEAMFLTKFTSHVDLLVRSTLKASIVLQEELKKYIDAGKITVHLATLTKKVIAVNNKVGAVEIETDGEKRMLDVDGVFVFIGLKPNTKFLEGSGVELDEQGLVKTNDKLMTSVKGVFAAGDVRSGATMQIASAVGEGATAALNIREYLNEEFKS